MDVVDCLSGFVSCDGAADCRLDLCFDWPADDSERLSADETVVAVWFIAFPFFFLPFLGFGTGVSSGVASVVGSNCPGTASGGPTWEDDVDPKFVLSDWEAGFFFFPFFAPGGGVAES